MWLPLILLSTLSLFSFSATQPRKDREEPGNFHKNCPKDYENSLWKKSIFSWEKACQKKSFMRKYKPFGLKCTVYVKGIGKSVAKNVV
jgi:hypothetical protein